MRVFDLGLKDNWRSFKEYVESRKKDSSTIYYFVYQEDNCGDEVYIFTSHSGLDEWLQQKFWDWERYDTRNLEDSMDDVKVWKLVSESDFKRLNTLYKKAKETMIVINGEKYYRTPIAISVEPTVIVSTNFY
ncbi:hypothetical protein AB1283_00930 [Bacillus sp. S13(2024)]|uniref:hypothetical protein n=1 Tax=Bacillus sp. S13(2024) TaxID=3162885 RepID=UPI003D1E8A94